jgi:hypothetical protein
MNRYEFEILMTLRTPLMVTLARRLHHVRMPAPSSILIASATVSHGTLLPGQGALNPGGRTRAIEEVKAKYSQKVPEFFERLIELSHSKNETIALQATRELLDRLIGKPVAVVDATHTKVDVAALYLQALKQVNEPVLPYPPHRGQRSVMEAGARWGWRASRTGAPGGVRGDRDLDRGFYVIAPYSGPL